MVKTNRQTMIYNGQNKQTNNEIQNTTQKTKDLAKRTPRNNDGGPRCSERVSRPFSTRGTHRVTLSTSLKL